MGSRTLPNNDLIAHVAMMLTQIGSTRANADSHVPTTELDSHANMVVVGKYATIIGKTGQYANVSPFSDDLPNLTKVEIVDAAIAYDDPYSLKSFLLVLRNALYIPSMVHNLVPPFLLREAGLIVNEEPKCQASDPTVEHHTIFDPMCNLRIHLQLNGIFLYFPSRPLTLQEMTDWESYDVIFLTPDSDRWTPHTTHFSDVEKLYVGADGDLILQTPRPLQHIVDDADVGELMGVHVDLDRTLTWSEIDAHIDSICNTDHMPDIVLTDDDIYNFECDNIRASLACNNHSNDPAIFSSHMTEQALMAKISMAFGCMVADSSNVCKVFAPDISTVTAGKAKGVDAGHLSKIWRISHEEAKRTLGVTTQLLRRPDVDTITRNYVTSDRMLRYQRLSSSFFTDTLFATASATSTRGNTCAQIFVSDKNYVAVYPMAKVSQYPSALRLFAKEVGAPKILVCDPHPVHKSRDVKTFLNKIGTTLRLLEAGTQWANRAELYVGHTQRLT